MTKRERVDLDGTSTATVTKPDEAPASSGPVVTDTGVSDSSGGAVISGDIASSVVVTGSEPSAPIVGVEVASAPSVSPSAPDSSPSPVAPAVGSDSSVPLDSSDDSDGERVAPVPVPSSAPVSTAVETGVPVETGAPTVTGTPSVAGAPTVTGTPAVSETPSVAGTTVDVGVSTDSSGGVAAPTASTTDTSTVPVASQPASPTGIAVPTDDVPEAIAPAAPLPVSPAEIGAAINAPTDSTPLDPGTVSVAPDTGAAPAVSFPDETEPASAPATDTTASAPTGEGTTVETGSDTTDTTTTGSEPSLGDGPASGPALTPEQSERDARMEKIFERTGLDWKAWKERTGR